MRTSAIFKRIMLQRRGDRRTLAMMFLAPIFILTLMYFLFQVPSNTGYRIGLNSDNSELTTAIKSLPEDENHFNVINVSDNKRTTMNDKKLEAIVTISDNDIDVRYANQSNGTTAAVKMLLTKVIQETQAKTSRENTEKLIDNLMKNIPQTSGESVTSQFKVDTKQYNITSTYLYGDPNSTNSTFDDMAPILVGAFAFFLVLLISGISLVNERTSGTLGRMLVTPVKRREIVTGYTLSYGILAIIQTAIMVIFTYWILGVHNNGNILWVFVINFMIAIIALLFGLLLSTVAKTEFQFVQMIPLAIVPQFLFSGLIPIETMPEVLQGIAHCIPVYYGINAMQLVVKRGVGFSGIWFDLIIMIIFAGILYVANVLTLKNIRRT
jgi:ABC-2 type transport system permease protein